MLRTALETHMVENAINQIVEDATLSKFESTNNAQDEIVLLNIVQVRAWDGKGAEGADQKAPSNARPCMRASMQVLGMAVQCEVGVLLSDQEVCKAFQVRRQQCQHQSTQPDQQCQD